MNWIKNLFRKFFFSAKRRLVEDYNGVECGMVEGLPSMNAEYARNILCFLSDPGQYYVRRYNGVISVIACSALFFVCLEYHFISECGRRYYDGCKNKLVINNSSVIHESNGLKSLCGTNYELTYMSHVIMHIENKYYRFNLGIKYDCDIYNDNDNNQKVNIIVNDRLN
jgi:hypothetical protein